MKDKNRNVCGQELYVPAGQHANDNKYTGFFPLGGRTKMSIIQFIIMLLIVAVEDIIIILYFKISLGGNPSTPSPTLYETIHMYIDHIVVYYPLSALLSMKLPR